ncbi:MAG TPA: hypothetical protein VLY03_00030 [Bacteroidota bacterium]|nr:hypothetical protein [Bacteroidota bacterium]
MILALIVLFTASAIAGGNPPTQNSYVQCRVQTKQKNLQPGSSGELLITLKPQEGIHINLQPAIDVKLDSSVAVTAVGKTEIPRQATANYLDTSIPVKQSFAVPKSAQPGNIVVRGTITYFYCSDAEGWCSRFKQPFLVNLTVVRSSP